MRNKTLMWIVIAGVVIVAAALTLRGEGAAFLHKWLPAMHGGGGGHK